MNQSPYTPPQSDLEQPYTAGDDGSVEDAIAGNYDFEIGDIIRESWEAIDGYKMPFAIVSTVYFIVFLLVMVPMNMLLGDSPAAPFISQAVQLLFAPMGAAFFIMGLHIATGQPINTSMLFAHYDKLLPIIGLQIVILVSVVLGMICLIIPGIYLSIAVMFAMPLLVEKDLSIIEAFETSRKAITHHWFKFFGLWLVMGLIMLISILPLGIGLFWTAPMMIAAMGILYRRLFGVSASVAA